LPFLLKIETDMARVCGAYTNPVINNEYTQ
jgi:hypothetical protein